MNLLTRLQTGFAEARGWRRRLAALALGVLATAALPPFGFWPVLFAAFPGLVWLIAASTGARAAFGAGWWFGFGHFCAGLYWIGNALLVDGAKFIWMMPFAVGALPAVLGLFTGAATLLAWRLGRGLWLAPALAGAWILSEWLRSWVATGLPWNLIGHAWTASDAMMQNAAHVGIYGLGGATVLVASLPAWLVPGLVPGPVPGSTARHGVRAALAGVALLTLMWAGGQVRLAADPPAGSGVRIRIVQASIPQRLKWREDTKEANLRRYVELSRGPGFEQVRAVIWPETTVAFFLEQDERRRRMAAEAAPPGGLLITGAPRLERRADGPHVWNSLVALDAAGTVVGTYDKTHLVPYGEYVPLRDWLPVEKVTPGLMDFSTGVGLRTLTLPGLPPVGPLICYEVIFPGRVVAADRPAWLLNLTNDGWYGDSTGPYQHFDITRVRAIEEGVPVVRAASTGISGVFDAHGRVVARADYDHVSVIDVELPGALTMNTTYGKYGDNLPLACALMLLISAAIGGGTLQRTINRTAT